MSFLHRFVIIPFVSLFYVGFLPLISGTLGSLITVLLYGYWHYTAQTIFFPVVVLTWALITLIAIPVCTYAGKKIFLEKDSSKIIIDEYSGMALSLFPVLYFPWGEHSLYYYILAFSLFRFFDISKTVGINDLQKLKGGLGVMLDDIVAGVYSMIIVIGVMYFL